MTATADSFTPLLDLIETTWGYRILRPLQREAMEAILARRDSVVVMPTGGGKSLCYQAPAVYLAEQGMGPTVVVSPLIALMKDQVDSLRSVGVAAASLDSSLTAEDRRQVAADLRSGKLQMLFVSPERLVGGGAEAAGWFAQMLRDAGVRTFAIDEAHCISQWGHDFRPEYRQLSNLKNLFEGCSIHAFTATATPQVRRDIADQLGLADPLTLVGNFDRPNLTYRVLPRRDLMKQIQEVLDRHKDEAGIIYCLRRRDVDEISETLNVLSKKTGRKALGYHAGMTPDKRRAVQEAFAQEECDLIVATIAFGMGIDRSNIRFVLHTGMPKSIEAYQQETGRAGRDGLEAECVLLYSAQDVMTWKSLVEKSAHEAAAAGTPVSPDYILAANRHLDDIDQFARGVVCRHRALVEYFGQRYQPPPPVEPAPGTEIESPTLALDAAADAAPPQSCNACDHCLGDTEPVPDALMIAQKILSAVARTEQRFGAGHVISVLRGENTEKNRQFRHDQLSVFGLLRDRSKNDLRNFIDQLIGQGALAQENVVLAEARAVRILKLNRASIEVMKGARQVRLIQLAEKTTEESRKSTAREISWEGVDRELFEALRVLRRQMAGERGMQPYMVFSDATLRELSRVRPTDVAHLRLVYGIGERKIKDFSDRILPFIAQHCADKNLSTNITGPAPIAPRMPAEERRTSAPRRSAARDEAFNLFRRGASIQEVAEQVARSQTTVAEYLGEFIESERPTSIASWVPDAVYRRVQDAARETGMDRLKPIFVALNESVPYELIRLVITHCKMTRG